LVHDLVVGDQADVDAVQRGGETIGYGREPAGDLDLGELHQHAAAAPLVAVVDDGFQAGDVLAFALSLQAQAPEVHLEHGQVIGRFLEHDLLTAGYLAVPVGQALAPNRVRRTGTSSRERVRSTMRSSMASSWPPIRNWRLRLHST